MKNSYLVCIKLSRSIEKILRTFLEMKAKWNLYPSGHRFHRFFTCLDFQSFSSFTFSLFCYFFFNFSLFKNKVNKLLKFKICFSKPISGTIWFDSRNLLKEVKFSWTLQLENVIIMSGSKVIKTIAYLGLIFFISSPDYDNFEKNIRWIIPYK